MTKQDKLNKLKALLETANQDFPTSQEVAKLFVQLKTAIKEVRESGETKYNDLLNELSILAKEHRTLSKSADYSVDYLHKEIKALKNVLANLKLQHGKDGKDYTLTDKDRQTIASMVFVPDNTETTAQKVLETIVIPEETGDSIIEKINDSEEKIKAERIEGSIGKNYDDDIATLQNRTQLLAQIASNKTSSASTFSSLTDTPLNYTGGASKAVYVKSDETGLEFKDAVSSDEKVKYDAGDPTSGYVADKIIAGTGISVAEGTGADENKLVITADVQGGTVQGTNGNTLNIRATNEGSIAGNARGEKSIDLTVGRALVTSVASGVGSIAMGENCTASGVDAIAMGDGARATAEDSISIGGGNSTGQRSVAIGENSGATANYATALGGFAMAASGTGSFCASGQYNRAAKENSISLGSQGEVRRGGELVHSSGWFATWVYGSLQHSLVTMRALTSNATPTEMLCLQSGTERFVLVSTSLLNFTIQVSGIDRGTGTDGTIGDCVNWEIKGAITRTAAGGTALVGDPVTTLKGYVGDGNLWSVAVTADTANNALKLTVTGEADKNLLFYATIQSAEIKI